MPKRRLPRGAEPVNQLADGCNRADPAPHCSDLLHMLRKFFPKRRAEERRIADSLYGQIVAAARQPFHYSVAEAPDTPLGRYEMLSLHVFLFLHRVRGEAGRMADVAQELTDMFFLEVEHSLREFGIGDMGVPKRMKKLAKMFYGRVGSYGDALDANDRAALEAALARNIRPGVENWQGAVPLADYAMRSRDALAAVPVSEFLEGRIAFAAVEDVAA
jgi:cytochrome b pre-mRNA-processing protein 3